MFFSDTVRDIRSTLKPLQVHVKLYFYNIIMLCALYSRKEIVTFCNVDTCFQLNCLQHHYHVHGPRRHVIPLW
jgi:hypothetical protein